MAVHLFMDSYFCYLNNYTSVAVAWSVEPLPSNPAALVQFPAGQEFFYPGIVCVPFVFCPVLPPAEVLILC